jgi:hypothetical protein
VAEALEEIAVVALDRFFGSAIVPVKAALEGRDVEVDLRVHPHAERVTLDIEEVRRTDPDGEKRLADEPQRLTHRTGARAVGVWPQIGGDGLARAGPRDEHEEPEQRLRVPAAQTDLPTGVRSDIEPPQQLDAKVDARAGCDRDSRHR